MEETVLFQVRAEGVRWFQTEIDGDRRLQTKTDRALLIQTETEGVWQLQAETKEAQIPEDLRDGSSEVPAWETWNSATSG